MRVPEIFQAGQQDAEPVALEPRDQVVVAHGARALSAADAGFQTPCRGGQQRIGDQRGRWRGAVDRSTEIDEQDGEVKPFVPGRPADRAGDVLDEQQAIRQAALGISDRRRGDVSMAAGDALHAAIGVAVERPGHDIHR